jgi:DNA repair protein RadC
LLTRHGGLGGLAKLSFDDLTHEPGLGEAKAAELQALFQLALRFATLEPQERAAVHSPQDVHALLGAEMALLEQEHLRVLMVNTRNQVLGIREVYIGSVKAALVRPAEVFRDAIRSNAPSIIVVHNHPSGDPSPSTEDIILTKGLVEAGKLLDIEVLDHIVIGDRRFVSLKSQGLWPK